MKLVVVSYAPLGPVMFSRGFPPCRLRPIGRTISESCHFSQRLMGHGIYRFIIQSHNSPYFIMFRDLVIEKSLISANFFQKKALKSIHIYC